VFTALLKEHARSDNKIRDGSRDEDLVTSGKRTNSRPDDYRQAAYVVADTLDFAGVDSDPDVEPQTRDRLHQCKCASDGAGWPVERDEEPVTGSRDLASPVAFELASNDRVEAL
jgi:hypothetical protein